MTKRPLLPKDEASIKVFAEPELFKAWAIIAEFQSAAFKDAGEREGVSRNRTMAHDLREGALAFWDDQGGFPKTKAEWDAKVAALAERIRATKKAGAHRRNDSSAEAAIAALAEMPKK